MQDLLLLKNIGKEMAAKLCSVGIGGTEQLKSISGVEIQNLSKEKKAELKAFSDTLK